MNIIKARYLRREETKAERLLWEQLRNSKLKIKFRRQHPVGNYILDFYAPKARLAIELDGDVHKESIEHDTERTKYLNSKRITVLRFWNAELENNIEVVIEKIKQYSPHPYPSPF